MTYPRLLPRPGRCVLILGMHRSGTSALAGSLRQAGVHLGKVLDTGFRLNPKGLQEPPAILHMHENLLEANGGAWHDPPGRIEWKPLHKAVRSLFIESRAGRDLWGFKEPRTLLVAEDWIEALPVWTATGIFRHPAEVAASLMARNGFDQGKCLRLWQIYNERLLALHRRHHIPVMEFSADPAAMRAGIERLLAHLGLAPSAPLSFYDETIPRNFRPDPDIPLPEGIASLLAALRDAAR